MNVPKLRFSEFHDIWEDEKIGKLFEFLPTNSLSRANLNYESGNAKNIHYGDIHTKYKTNLDCAIVKIPFINSDVDLDTAKIESYCMSGDLIIADASEDYEDIGKAVELKNVNNDKLLAGLHTFLARDKSGLTVDGYRGYMFLNYDLKLQIKKIATGISVLGISKTNLNKITIKIPSIQEQEKIASFLSKVDEKIELLEKKLELWKSYKKGMIQQLLTQKLRFKDENGRDYPDWDEKKFNKIFDFISTNSFSRADLNYENGNALNIHYGDIHTKFPIILNFDKIKVPFINENINLDNFKNELYCKEGDLVIADASEDYKDIGKAIELMNINEKKVLAGLHTILARDKKGYTICGFRCYMLMENSVKLQLKKFATGVSVLGISKTNLGKIDLKIPSIQEQVKISALLSSIYTKIELINKELEINKEFKKGLLQQMFC